MEKVSDMNLITDAQLIELLKEGNHIAYTEIYKRYNSLLIAFAFKRLQDDELTKDLVQDLFLKLWANRKKITIVSNLAGYLVTSLKHSVFNYFQHQKVTSKYAESLTDFVNTGNIAHTDYLVREREWELHIDAAIASLPEKMRKAFLLNKKEHHSYAETARELNTTENNVQKHINGAIKILKTKLTIFL
ncbi:MAG TPA: RNA polymerase sigma-70 factor [Pedobacter sp.]|nr:RNA polymerase sigma-70 factor [Pedobacter sp.]